MPTKRQSGPRDLSVVTATGPNRSGGRAGSASRPAQRQATAVSAGIPLNLVQRWLAHPQLTTTTAIHADAVGAEEKDIARRMWQV